VQLRVQADRRRRASRAGGRLVAALLGARSARALGGRVKLFYSLASLLLFIVVVVRGGGLTLLLSLVGLFLLGALVLWGLQQLRRPTVQGLPPDKPVWMLDAPTDLPSFYRQLTALVPAESVLCIEGGAAGRIGMFLEKHKLDNTERVKPDALFGALLTYVPVRDQVMAELASLIEKEPAESPFTHIKVFCGKSVLLHWHDADIGNPIYLSSEISESKVREFAGNLRVSYQSILPKAAEGAGNGTSRVA
jgi:hypothetical protein